MPSKKKILHVIESFGMGGAEKMLTRTLSMLDQYDHVFVIFHRPLDLASELPSNIKLYVLSRSLKNNFLDAVFKLRKVIRKEKPDLISSHLFFASVVARICCPKNIPLIFSIHSKLSLDCYQNSKTSTLMEKITYSKRFAVLSVSNSILDDFDSWIGIKGASFVLPNYVPDEFFEKDYRFSLNRPVRLIAVGNLKELKNHILLVQAFKQLDNRLFTLDIYGDGYMRDILQKEITENHLSISLKGIQNDLSGRLPDYDIFILPSKYEGFGIAVVEAMAIGLPLILSGTEVLKETTEGNAVFFNINNPDELVQILHDVHDGKYDLGEMSNKGKLIAEKYNQKNYLEKLNSIFETVMGSTKNQVHKI